MKAGAAAGPAAYDAAPLRGADVGAAVVVAMLTRLARQWCADLLVLGKSGVTLGALAAWASSSPI